MANLILWNAFAGLPERTIGVYQIANWVRLHGYTVKVIDFCSLMPTKKLVELTEKHIGPETIAIGVSSTFWNSSSTTAPSNVEPKWLVYARDAISSKPRHFEWILGGARSHKMTLQYNWVRFHDYAEDALLKWLDEKSNVNNVRKKYDIVDHCGFTFQHDDAILPQEVLPIELSRGCRFECSFCKFPLLGKTPGTYIRSKESFREELIRNYNEFGTTNYNFTCDTYNESPEKVQMVHDVVQSLPFKINWVGYLRLDLIASRPEQIQLLKDSGLRSAFFGIESFHPQASMAVGKGWNGKKGKDFLLELKDKWKDDITWQLSFIVGLPGESKEHLQETFNWCVDNKMKCWHYHPLGLSTMYEDEVKSKFERESEKYGYTMTGPNTWKNDLWTSDTAMNYAKELNSLAWMYQSPAGFQASKFVSMGYSYEHTLHGKYGITDWDSWPDFADRVKAFVDNYVTTQQHQKRVE